MKTIFWNVDTLHDFMRKDGLLYVQDAELIEPKLAIMTDLAAKYNKQTVNTADWHNEDTEEIAVEPDFMMTFPKHSMENTFGATFIPATIPRNPYAINWKDDKFDKDKVRNAREIVLYKDKFDIFAGNPHADEVLKVINPDRAIVYGVATNVCVDQAVRGLPERNVDVYVPTDAIKELPNLPLQEVLDNWVDLGAKLTQTKNVEYLVK